jgi:uncharacterized protein YndB with AHSA1/START domain
MSHAIHRPERDRTSLEVHGTHATLAFRRFLPHAPERVWKALTDPDDLRQWFLTEAEVDHRIGGKIDFVTTSSRIHGTGRILAWEPFQLYEYEWNVEPNSLLPDGERTVVRWELTPSKGGTLLSLTHRNLTARTARIYHGGMGSFLNRLAALLDGTPLPDWGQGIRREPGGDATSPSSDA